MPTVTHVTVRNDLTLACVVALVNAALTLVITFGVHLTSQEQASIVGFVNVAVMLAARVLNLPEKTADGGTIQVKHVPTLVTTPPPEPLHPVAVTTPPDPATVTAAPTAA